MLGAGLAGARLKAALGATADFVWPRRLKPGAYILLLRICERTSDSGLLAARYSIDLR